MTSWSSTIRITGGGGDAGRVVSMPRSVAATQGAVCRGTLTVCRPRCRESLTAGGVRLRALARRRQAVPDCALQERGVIDDAELLHQPAAIGLDRLRGEIDGAGDLGARAAFDDELQHLALARAQALERAFRAVAGGGSGADPEGGAEIAAPGANRADRRNHLRGGRLLEHVARRASLERAMHVLRARVHGEHHDPRLRTLLAQKVRGLDTVEIGHRDVHHDHVRHELAGDAYRLAAVADFGDDFDVRRGGEQRAQALAHHPVVVGEQHARLHARALATSTMTRGPWPGSDSMRRSAPTASARSRMVITPYVGAPARERAGSKPTPSSSTVSSSPAGRVSSFTTTLRARACLPTLLSASCAMRKSAVSTAIDGRGCSSPSTATGIPRRSPNGFANAARAAARP